MGVWSSDHTCAKCVHPTSVLVKPIRILPAVDLDCAPGDHPATTTSHYIPPRQQAVQAVPLHRSVVGVYTAGMIDPEAGEAQPVVHLCDGRNRAARPVVDVHCRRSRSALATAATNASGARPVEFVVFVVTSATAPATEELIALAEVRAVVNAAAAAAAAGSASGGRGLVLRHSLHSPQQPSAAGMATATASSTGPAARPPQPAPLSAVQWMPASRTATHLQKGTFLEQESLPFFAVLLSYPPTGSPTASSTKPRTCGKGDEKGLL